MLKILFADSYRKNGRCRLADVLRGLAFSRTHRVVITLRLCQALKQSHALLRLFLPFFRILHWLACQLAGVDFPWKTRIGHALAITHGWCLVVNKDVRIGSNVTLFHGVTLGQGDRILASGERISGYPIIEDDVWVGPHAIVVGGVIVGKGSRIAGGAFVAEDVPPYSLVLGNPAVIVKTGITPDVFNRYAP